MIVEQIYTNNAWRNFNYLIACPETGEAIAIDHLEHEKCLSAAKRLGWNIVKILNTHEHGDHTGGNGPMIAATGAKLLAHHAAKNKIPDIFHQQSFSIHPPSCHHGFPVFESHPILRVFSSKIQKI